MSTKRVTVEELLKTLEEMRLDQEVVINTPPADAPEDRERKVCVLCNHDRWRVDVSGEIECGQCGSKPHAWALELL